MRYVILGLLVCGLSFPAAAQQPSGKQFLANQVSQLNAAIADLIDQNTQLKAENEALKKQLDDAKKATPQPETGKK